MPRPVGDFAAENALVGGNAADFVNPPLRVEPTVGPRVACDEKETAWRDYVGTFESANTLRRSLDCGGQQADLPEHDLAALDHVDPVRPNLVVAPLKLGRPTPEHGRAKWDEYR
jgi:hypothetical protein